MPRSRFSCPSAAKSHDAMVAILTGARRGDPCRPGPPRRPAPDLHPFSDQLTSGVSGIRPRSFFLNSSHARLATSGLARMSTAVMASIFAATRRHRRPEVGNSTRRHRVRSTSPASSKSANARRAGRTARMRLPRRQVTTYLDPAPTCQGSTSTEWLRRVAAKRSGE
jgi:hypothetical protein